MKSIKAKAARRGRRTEEEKDDRKLVRDRLNEMFSPQQIRDWKKKGPLVRGGNLYYDTKLRVQKSLHSELELARLGRLDMSEAHVGGLRGQLKRHRVATGRPAEIESSDESDDYIPHLPPPKAAPKGSSKAVVKGPPTQMTPSQLKGALGKMNPVNNPKKFTTNIAKKHKHGADFPVTPDLVPEAQVAAFLKKPGPVPKPTTKFQPSASKPAQGKGKAPGPGIRAGTNTAPFVPPKGSRLYPNLADSVPKAPPKGKPDNVTLPPGQRRMKTKDLELNFSPWGGVAKSPSKPATKSPPKPRATGRKNPIENPANVPVPLYWDEEIPAHIRGAQRAAITRAQIRMGRAIAGLPRYTLKKGEYNPSTGRVYDGSSGSSDDGSGSNDENSETWDTKRRARFTRRAEAGLLKEAPKPVCFNKMDGSHVEFDARYSKNAWCKPGNPAFDMKATKKAGKKKQTSYPLDPHDMRYDKFGHPVTHLW